MHAKFVHRCIVIRVLDDSPFFAATVPTPEETYAVSGVPLVPSRRLDGEGPVRCRADQAAPTGLGSRSQAESRRKSSCPHGSRTGSEAADRGSGKHIGSLRIVRQRVTCVASRPGTQTLQSLFGQPTKASGRGHLFLVFRAYYRNVTSAISPVSEPVNVVFRGRPMGLDRCDEKAVTSML